MRTALAAVIALGCTMKMPGASYAGAPAQPSEHERVRARRLHAHVQVLAEQIGERHTGRPSALGRARDYVASQLRAAGYATRRQGFDAGGIEVFNIEATLAGTAAPDEIIVVGAHYDSAVGTPGANDNGSGTAAMLVLAQELAGREFRRTIRFVGFVNEEPPWFRKPAMGSLVYARSLAARAQRVVAMFSLETMGYYDTSPGSQVYPAAVARHYPTTGDFIAFVGNVRSRDLVLRSVESFREHATIPSEGGAVPGAIPGVGWSDHWSFWRAGYPGVMVTDTAPNRYPHYHAPTDTPDRLDYPRLSAVVSGLLAVLQDLADDPAAVP